jgi:hypothetical protein
MKHGSKAMRDHPATNKVIIVNIQRPDTPEEPVLAHERMLKAGALDYAGAKERCTPRDHKDAAIDGMARGAFKVVTFEIDARDEIEEVAEGHAPA